MIDLIVIVLWVFVIALAIDEWYTRKYDEADDEF